MKTKLISTLLILFVVATILSACAPQASSGSTETLTIGYTISQTGSQEANSRKQFRGFELWMQQVNNAGGIKLADGTVVKFEVVNYDDQSDSNLVVQLYGTLANQDNVDILISPYSSGLTGAAADVAEQFGKIMIAVGAASDSIMNKGYQQVYQVYTPSSRYFNGAIDLLRAKAPQVTKLAFVYENDPFAIDVVNVSSQYAERLGYEVVLVESYETGTEDFGVFIDHIVESGAQAVLGGGHTTDGQAFAIQVNQRNIGIGFFALLVAPAEPDFSSLWDAALGVIGPSQWEPSAAFSQASAQSAGYEWIGPDSQEFVTAYEAAYNEVPSYHSAGGYAAGLILQQALLKAGTTELGAINTALENLDVMTFYGYIKFDTSDEWHGLQIGHSMVYIQWQAEEGGLLGKQVVWPAEGASANLLYPIP